MNAIEEAVQWAFRGAGDANRSGTATAADAYAHLSWDVRRRWSSPYFAMTIVPLMVNTGLLEREHGEKVYDALRYSVPMVAMPAAS